MIKINHVLLVPSIVLSLPAAALLQQQLLIAAILLTSGLASMLARSRIGASLVSTILLGLIIWGKVATDLYQLPGIDSALLLLQFMIVILLMEASNATISFERGYRLLGAKTDEISENCRRELIVWMREHLKNLATLVTVATGLSLGLLVLGDLISVSINQIAFSGVLVLLAVVVLLVLVVYGREPEPRDR